MSLINFITQDSRFIKALCKGNYLMDEEIRPITMPGIHEKFLSFFESEMVDKNAEILDVGAGHGAFSKRLYDLGYKVSACDLFPENFHFKSIECQKADLTKKLPYKDNSFSIAIAIEVSEHINDHEVFFSELNRILKPNGVLYMSTPNILSLKSRLKFLFSGYFYSFEPLDLKNYDGLQHVSALTIDQYNYIASKYGFNTAHIEIDKKQGSSKFLHVLLGPLLWAYQKIKNSPTNHNMKKLVLGRLVFLKFENNKN